MDKEQLLKLAERYPALLDKTEKWFDLQEKLMELQIENLKLQNEILSGDIKNREKWEKHDAEILEGAVVVGGGKKKFEA